MMEHGPSDEGSSLSPSLPPKGQIKQLQTANLEGVILQVVDDQDLLIKVLHLIDTRRMLGFVGLDFFS